jgi:hypothetical protein
LRWNDGGVQETLLALFAGSLIAEPGIWMLATGVIRIPLRSGRASNILLKERGIDMDSTLIVRIVAGVLVVVILAVLIQRRRTKVK